MFELWCPRQLFLPIPAASLREECYRKLSTGGTHGKRYARYSTAVERRGFGRNIDQLVCHDASPLLHTLRWNVRTLKRTQVSPAESVWLSIL